MARRESPNPLALLFALTQVKRIINGAPDEDEPTTLSELLLAAKPFDPVSDDENNIVKFAEMQEHFAALKAENVDSVAILVLGKSSHPEGTPCEVCGTEHAPDSTMLMMNVLGNGMILKAMATTLIANIGKSHGPDDDDDGDLHPIPPAPIPDTATPKYPTSNPDPIPDQQPQPERSEALLN